MTLRRFFFLLLVLATYPLGILILPAAFLWERVGAFRRARTPRFAST